MAGVKYCHSVVGVLDQLDVCLWQTRIDSIEGFEGVRHGLLQKEGVEKKVLLESLIVLVCLVQQGKDDLITESESHHEPVISFTAAGVEEVRG